MNLNLNDPAIESPKRIALLGAIMDHLGYDDDPMSVLIYDAYETDAESLFPYYTVALDRDDFDPRAFLIHMIHSLAGSDDDYDDFGHDADHAQGTTEPCSGGDNDCATCCDNEH